MQAVTWSPMLGQAVRAMKKHDVEANRMSNEQWRRTFSLSSEEAAILATVSSEEKGSKKKGNNGDGSWA